MVGTERLVRGSTPRASVPDTMRVAAKLVLPLVGRGAIVRRREVVDATEKMGADARAVRLVQELRDRYGDGPVQLSVPGRSFALVLDPADARRVLAETPVPFATANLEKRAALSHFQPEGAHLPRCRAGRPPALQRAGPRTGQARARPRCPDAGGPPRGGRRHPRRCRAHRHAHLGRLRNRLVAGGPSHRAR